MTDLTNTPDEVLDLVNENDEVIGEVLKGVANADPKLIHREVAIIISDKANRVLLQQRSFRKKVFPGYWSFSAAGHIKKGMTPEQTAHEELQEELGFDVELKFIKKEMISLENETFFEHWYTGTYTGQQIIIDTNEIEQYKFASEIELRQMVEAGELEPVTAQIIKTTVWNN